MEAALPRTASRAAPERFVRRARDSANLIGVHPFLSLSSRASSAARPLPHGSIVSREIDSGSVHER